MTLPITVQCENLTQSHSESWASLRPHAQTLAKILQSPTIPSSSPSHQGTSYHCKTKYLHLPLKVTFCLLSLYYCICSLCWKTLPFPPKTTLTHPFRWEAAEVPNPRDLEPALYKVLLIFWKALCVSSTAHATALGDNMPHPYIWPITTLNLCPKELSNPSWFLSNSTATVGASKPGCVWEWKAPQQMARDDNSHKLG